MRFFASVTACTLSSAPLILASVLSNLALAQPPVIPKLSSSEVVRFGITSGKPLTLAGVYVAMARGYFKESGLTNELVTAGGFNDLLAPVATGDIDIAIGGPGTALFNAIERGVKLRIVADAHTASSGRSSNALLVRKDLVDTGNVKGFADFRGRRIALASRRGPFELALLEALRSAGLNSSDVRFVVMSYGQINAAFAAGTIDIGFQVEPLVAVAVAQKFAVRWRGIDELAPNQQNAFIIASEGFAARRDVARAWMVAYLRGVRDYNDAMFNGKGREEMIQILMNYTAVKKRGLYDQMVMPGISPDGELNVDDIKKQAQELKAAGDIKGTAPVDQTIDLSFVRYAQSVLGAYAK